jgi:hypothetical protein
LTHQYVGDIITVQHEGGQFEVTGGHPIWVKSGFDLESRPRCEHIFDNEHELQPHGRWVNARDLQVGDELFSRANPSLQIRSISVRSEITTVYNLTVADYHTYTVGTSEILVHNNALVNNVSKSPLASEILKTRKGSINNAPLPKGSPSWDEMKTLKLALVLIVPDIKQSKNY